MSYIHYGRITLHGASPGYRLTGTLSLYHFPGSNARYSGPEANEISKTKQHRIGTFERPLYNSACAVIPQAFIAHHRDFGDDPVVSEQVNEDFTKTLRSRDFKPTFHRVLRQST